MNDSVTVIDIVAQVTDETASGANSATRNVSRLEQSMQRLQSRIDGMRGRSNIEVRAELRDMATRGIQSITAAGKKLAGKVWTVTLKAKDLVTAPFRKVLGLLSNPIAQATAFAGVSVGLADTISTGMSFNKSISQIAATMGKTTSEIADLRAAAKGAGSTTAFTAAQSAEALNYMALAGYNNRQAIEALPNVLNLAAAGNMDLADASDMVTDAQSALCLTMEQSAEMVDKMAMASTKTNTSVSQLGDAILTVGGTAKNLAGGTTELASVLGVLADNGIKGAEGGTALRNVILSLSAPTDKAAAAIDSLGLKVFDVEGNLRALPSVFSDLNKSLSSMTSQARTEALNTIFNRVDLKSVEAILGTSADRWNSLSASINNAQGAAERMSNTQLDNLSGDITLLQSAADGAKIAISERLDPYLRSFVQWITSKMPDVEKAAGSALDFIVGKAEALSRSVSGLMSSASWQSAGTPFDKLKLAWDTIIAEPFEEWWSGSGKVWLAEKAQGIGAGLGSALKFGILGLLGVDICGVASDGASIGKSFAEGFVEGFDAGKIASGLLEALKNVAKDAARLFAGNASGTSSISASLLGYGALKIGGAGYNLYRGGNALLGGTALGGGMATAASAAAGFGGAIAAGASLVSAVKDLYSGIKSDDLNERGANVKSGLLKGGGVAAGAAIGAGIGSFIPVVGTGVGALVGAGIGGLVGMAAGDRAKADYLDEQNAPALAAEKAKYKSQELKDALGDAGVSADDFAMMLEKAVRTDISKHFGKMALSASEMADVARSLTDMGNLAQMNAFRTASADRQATYQSMNSHAGTMDKLNWKIGMGFSLSDSELSTWQQDLDSFYSDVQSYLENAHYEAATAIKLLVGPDSEFDLSGLDSVYSSLSEQLKGIGEQYKGKIQLALEDGVITLDEQAEIQNLQDQITAITNKVSEIETTANMKALQIKYSGAALDSDSFAALQSELSAQVETATASYDEALRVGIQSLELQLSEGAIDQGQYNEQLQALADGYDAKISELQLSVESFQLESIADAYARDLEGILPDIQGTTAEKLQTAISNALTSGVDVAKWDTATASKWLGLDSMNKETQTAIAGLVSSVAETLPKNMKEGITAGFEDADLGGSIGNDLSKEILSTNMGPVKSAADTLKADTSSLLESAFADGFDISTTVRIRSDYSFASPTGVSNLTGSALISAGVAKNAKGSIVTAPLLSLVGEEGPEAIIPLSAGRRGRGLDLWKKAGQMLGVPQYSDGDIVGAAGEAIPTNSNANAGAVVPVTIENITFEVRVDGAGSNAQALANEIESVIREKMPELTNEVAQRIAEALQQIYSNTPKSNWR